MNIMVSGRNVEVTPALRKYAEEKIAKFDRYLSNITEAVVTLSIQKQNHKAEVLIKGNGLKVQAEGSTSELYSAIDEVASKLHRQVKKHKEKMVSHRKSDVGKNRSAVAAVTAKAATEEAGVIIEKKRFETKPMALEEAAMNLEMSDKAFFVFTNAQSGGINVIYKMNDGNLGLIEPV
jgi:putative sigma-54 modulation protein